MAANRNETQLGGTPQRWRVVEKELDDLVLSVSGKKKVRKQKGKAVAFLRDFMYIELLPGRMHLFLRARYCGTSPQFSSWEAMMEYIKREPHYSTDAEAMLREVEEIQAYEKKYGRTLIQATTLIERLADYRNRDDQRGASPQNGQKSL